MGDRYSAVTTALTSTQVFFSPRLMPERTTGIWNRTDLTV